MRSEHAATEVSALRLSRSLLLVNVVLYGVYGVAYLLAPDLLTSFLTGARFPNSTVAIDLRAVYGGMSTAFAATLWLLMRGGVELQRVGQFACVAAFGLLALGRALGMIAERAPSLLMITVMVGEVGFAALSLYMLSRLGEPQW
jgi:hypothetical protein